MQCQIQNHKGKNMFQIIQAIVFFMALTSSSLILNAIAKKTDFDGNIPFYLAIALWTILFYMSLIS